MNGMHVHSQQQIGSSPARCQKLMVRSYCSVYTGQMFSQKIEGIPSYIVSAVTLLVQSFTRMVSSASIIENSDAPTVMYPLILGAQSIHVARQGEEPQISPDVDLEDVRLMAPSQLRSDRAPSASERRAFFSKESNRQVRTLLCQQWLRTSASWHPLVLLPHVCSNIKLQAHVLHTCFHLDGRLSRPFTCGCPADGLLRPCPCLHIPCAAAHCGRCRLQNSHPLHREIQPAAILEGPAHSLHGLRPNIRTAFVES
jgi:hypothetical protein